MTVRGDLANLLASTDPIYPLLSAVLVEVQQVHAEVREAISRLERCEHREDRVIETLTQELHSLAEVVTADVCEHRERRSPTGWGHPV